MYAMIYTRYTCSVSFKFGRKVCNCKFSNFIITIKTNISLKSCKVEVFHQPTEEINDMFILIVIKIAEFTVVYFSP